MWEDICRFPTPPHLSTWFPEYVTDFPCVGMGIGFVPKLKTILFWQHRPCMMRNVVYDPRKRRSVFAFRTFTRTKNIMGDKKSGATKYNPAKMGAGKFGENWRVTISELQCSAVFFSRIGSLGSTVTPENNVCFYGLICPRY